MTPVNKENAGNRVAPTADAPASKAQQRQPPQKQQQQQQHRKPLGNGAAANHQPQHAGRHPFFKQSNDYAKPAAMPAAARPSGRPKAAWRLPGQFGGGQVNYTVYNGKSHNYNGQPGGFNGLQYLVPAAAPAVAGAGNRRSQFNPAAARAPLPGGNPPKPQVQAQPRPSYGNGQVRAQEAKHWAPVAPFPPAQPIPQPRNAVANGNQDDGGMCAIM